jgi:hypothetical protein
MLIYFYARNSNLISVDELVKKPLKMLPLSLVHTNIQRTDPFFCIRPIFLANAMEKIGRKDRKICPSDFFNVIKNCTDVKKSDRCKKTDLFFVCSCERSFRTCSPIFQAFVPIGFPCASIGQAVAHLDCQLILDCSRSEEMRYRDQFTCLQPLPT